MHRIAIPTVFPLRLAPFEWFMLEDDQPGYPMTFVFWLRLSGHIRRSAFESALEAALARHPLLHAVVELPAQSLPFWKPNSEIAPYLDWDAQGTPLGCTAGERIDLTSEAGLRVWVRQGEDSARVTLQFHHACCDGLGALQFIGDLLGAYGIRTAAGDGRPTLQPLDENRLLTRDDDFSESLPPSSDRSQKKGTALRRTFESCSCHASPLNLPRTAAFPENDHALFAGICTRTLDSEQSRCLLAAARRQGVTLNDLLLCWMFLTIVRWNEQHGSRPPRPWLSVAMPASLREPKDDRMPAANRVTINFIIRAIDDCRDARSLLKSIHQETAGIRQTRDGSNFLKILKLLR